MWWLCLNGIFANSPFWRSYRNRSCTFNQRVWRGSLAGAFSFHLSYGRYLAYRLRRETWCILWGSKYITTEASGCVGKWLLSLSGPAFHSASTTRNCFHSNKAWNNTVCNQVYICAKNNRKFACSARLSFSHASCDQSRRECSAGTLSILETL